MEEHRIINYLLKFIIKIAFELCRVKQLAKQSEVSELYKKLKKHGNSNKKFLKIQLVYCIKYKQQSQSKAGIKKPKVYSTSLMAYPFHHELSVTGLKPGLLKTLLYNYNIFKIFKMFLCNKRFLCKNNASTYCFWVF